MTSERLRWRINELGLGVNALARLMDVNQRTAARWVSGRNEIPPEVEEVIEMSTADDVAWAIGRGSW